MVNKLKEFFLKNKWKIITGITVVILVIIYLLNLGKDKEKKMIKWMNKNRSKLVKDAVEHEKKKVDKVDKELKKVDKKIEKIDRKINATESKEKQKQTMREMSNEFKKLGY